MIRIYGSMLCPDCVQCRRELDEAGIPYAYLDFAEDLCYLKEFLALRDSHSAFSPIRAAGKIGIPAILLPEGEIIFDWDCLRDM